MRARYVVAAAAVCAVAGCSSSGSTAAGTPAQGGTTPTPTPTPSPTPTGFPKVTEVFTVLPCPAHPKATVELQGCAEHRIVRLDGQINRRGRALYRAQSDASSKAVFAAAQQAWIGYRQAECVSEADAYTGGTLYPVVFADCLARIDQQRLQDLRGIAKRAS